MKQDELAVLLQLLTDWAKLATSELNLSGCYLFGSLVYKKGEQFGDTSDVDIVVVMPDLPGIVERWRWLQKLAQHKDSLEGKLLKLLHRSALEPIASVTPVTTYEVGFDVHKDGHREFYRSNQFLDLLTGSIHEGLKNAGSELPSRFVTSLFAAVQKLRNEYLGTSANGTALLKSYFGADPIPKRIMRAAAMAARERDQSLGRGAEYDVQEGLDLVTDELYRLREEDTAFRSLQNVLSIRRNARGDQRSLTAEEQMLLGELVFGLVVRPTDTAIVVGGTSLPDHGKKPQEAPSPTPPPSAEVTPLAGMEMRPSGGNTLPEAVVDTISLDTESGTYLSNSLAFFHNRFARAFPGVRETKWFEDPSQISMRLERLLEEPLISPQGRTAIWWWRGGNYHVESFRRLEDGTFLMNFEELDIRRIAAVPGRGYQWSFVYVESNPMPPTGLYKSTPEDTRRRIERWGYDNEEYGLYRGETFITRGEYDDGAAEIEGKIVDTIGLADLRVRYTTPYNFIIAPHGSPINNSDFDGRLVEMLNSALQSGGTGFMDNLAEAVAALPLRHYDS